MITRLISCIQSPPPPLPTVIPDQNPIDVLPELGAAVTTASTQSGSGILALGTLVLVCALLRWIRTR